MEAPSCRGREVSGEQSAQAPGGGGGTVPLLWRTPSRPVRTFAGLVQGVQDRWPLPGVPIAQSGRKTLATCQVSWQNWQLPAGDQIQLMVLKLYPEAAKAGAARQRSGSTHRNTSAAAQGSARQPGEHHGDGPWLLICGLRANGS
jgi:hypothetical protein